MGSEEHAALEAQVNALDTETARRVARLVLECRASLPLALLAVRDANQSIQERTDRKKPARPLRRLAKVLAGGGVMS